MDDATFDTMLADHRPMLTRVAASIVGADAADDCVQDAALRAWRSRATFDGRNAGGWLATIVRNQALGSLRRRRFVTVALEALPDRGDRTPGPEALTLAREVGEAIAAALVQIPRDQAEAVLLCCGAGAEYHDAAAELGAEKATIGTRVFRGRRRLRTLLQGM